MHVDGIFIRFGDGFSVVVARKSCDSECEHGSNVLYIYLYVSATNPFHRNDKLTLPAWWTCKNHIHTVHMNVRNSKWITGLIHRHIDNDVRIAQHIIIYYNSQASLSFTHGHFFARVHSCSIKLLRLLMTFGPEKVYVTLMMFAGTKAASPIINCGTLRPPRIELHILWMDVGVGESIDSATWAYDWCCGLVQFTKFNDTLRRWRIAFQMHVISVDGSKSAAWVSTNWLGGDY